MLIQWILLQIYLLTRSLMNAIYMRRLVWCRRLQIELKLYTWTWCHFPRTSSVDSLNWAKITIVTLSTRINCVPICFPLVFGQFRRCRINATLGLWYGKWQVVDAMNQLSHYCDILYFIVFITQSVVIRFIIDQ